MTDPAPLMADPLALYVHWPFCLSKCPYCDFNSHVREQVDHGRWRAALLAELDYFAALTGPRALGSIFFGGGTPSLMDPETTAAVIERACRWWTPDPDIEITLEANPTSVEAGRLRAFRDAGVNRVSLGVQALDDDALALLGRQHGAAEALAAVETARKVFPRHSFDLIYARPDQTVADWRAELARALDYVGDHLSVYQLTIEKGTPFHGAVRRGDLVPPDEDRAAGLYDATRETLEDAGLPAYEISNHARPGGESRHNLAYWRYGDYVGVGPGAHGRLSVGSAHGRLSVGGELLATEQLRAPEAWLERVEAEGSGARSGDPLSRQDRRDEMLMMGLRLTEGVDRARFRARVGAGIESCLAADRLRPLLDEGYIVIDNRGIRATADGRVRLNAILAYLLAEPVAAGTARGV